ncbi:transcriptional regulator [Persicimonas caeni]|uniref:Transcriptional regulator n=1 Tax=Persicimonas caeni TaxID=2292766 RepID=A0A4Y6PQM4_PERCE|nr:P-II family nitrogen regulator [Persicimonas caeni]QDG50616.1 transcriptional regulator [Persicimonas caeni]QED31837.1 transcriptional regulator [Persicimonas caeni]
MRAVKRIEIVIDSLQIDRMVELLDDAGVSGYTVLPNARGRGRRGVRSGDEITGALENIYVMTICESDNLDTVLAAIRPLLDRFGGMCVVSDAELMEA